MNLATIPAARCTARPTTTSSRCGPAWGRLDVELKEVDDWICCGATAAHSLNHKLALALPARNLALAETRRLRGDAGAVPDVLDAAAQGAQGAGGDEALRQQMSEIVELEVRGERRVLNLIQVFE